MFTDPDLKNIFYGSGQTGNRYAIGAIIFTFNRSGSIWGRLSPNCWFLKCKKDPNFCRGNKYWENILVSACLIWLAYSGLSRVCSKCVVGHIIVHTV